MFRKCSNRCLTAGKKKIGTALLSIHNIIIIIINLFRQVFNVSVWSAQRKIFVTACIFDIMQYDFMLQNILNCRELSNLPSIGHLSAQSQQ